LLYDDILCTWAVVGIASESRIKVDFGVSGIEPVDSAITVLASLTAHHIVYSTDGPVENWRKIFDLNVLGLSVCTKEALQSMKERGVDDGHIIHINRFVRKIKTD
jgi:NAD(P)-dependent dehydrogenase (short-subunit alcohol dehydrogenase family)